MAVKGIKSNTDRIQLEEYIPMDTPLRVAIDVSSACNFQCLFCPHGNKEAVRCMSQGLIETTLAKKCIDDLTEFNQKIKCLSFFRYGEPLLHKNLPEIIAYATKQKVADRIDITTNASLLTPCLSEQLIAAGLHQFDISIYGLDSETYQRFCGYRLDFDALVRNISFLYSIKKDATVVTKISDAVCRSQEEEQKFYDIFGPISDKVCIEHAIPLWHDFKDEVDDDNVGIYGMPASHKEVCTVPFYTMTIQSNGIISACRDDWKCQLPVGNAYHESLFSVWHGEKYRELCIRLLKGGNKSVSPCNRCYVPDLVLLDNIDPFREEILKRMEGNSDEI